MNETTCVYTSEQVLFYEGGCSRFTGSSMSISLETKTCPLVFSPRESFLHVPICSQEDSLG